jgi:hypothetical protein
MTHALVALVAAAALAPVPDDIAVSLPSTGIVVVDATDVAASSLAVSPQRALRVARRNFGGFAHPYTSDWVRVGRVTLHLVRVVRSNSMGPLGLFPGQLVWLVVVRDVTLPIFGPPGRRGPRSYVGMLAVFVRTDVPRYILAAGF